MRDIGIYTVIALYVASTTACFYITCQSESGLLLLPQQSSSQRKRMQLWIVNKEMQMGEKGVMMTRKLPMILMPGNWDSFTMVLH